MLKNKKNIHFIGIGGIGMSGLALYLHEKGFQISGTDLEISENTHRLKNHGIPVTIGHRPDNINNPDLVIYTAAISKDNPEMQTTKQKNIPLIPRSELLAEVCHLTQFTVAVSGTHGKTSTTSLIGYLLAQAGLNPVIISGGILKNYQSNLKTGSDFVTVVEADEYAKSFLKINPDFAVITNIDPDHMECYGSMENLKQDFIQFANQARKKVILCQDDERLKSIASAIKTEKIYYSAYHKTDLFATDISYHNLSTNFLVNSTTEITLPTTGTHNVQNSLAALSIAREFNINPRELRAALKHYKGVERRFEIRFKTDDHILIDDYAHHPKELKTTLEGAKKAWPTRPILAIFQPHLYSRTQYFYREFAEALSLADKVIVTDVYPAREAPIPGVSGKIIYDELQIMKNDNINYAKDKSEWINKILTLKEPGDIIISFGAGDINQVHKKLIEKLA